ncbi:TIGR02206 family membrane protein [Gammaproteobacteria bacterium]|nr:TIGR02206 family membrane protein [Gammaproteobacteria bacterium]MDA8929648.1 TIGR02206 family membrane protein [Gammaproteobacteria bacterium]MDA9041093.1 TIGR02206 family membrane protein [Gammaproteobacteria bacterium]
MNASPFILFGNVHLVTIAIIVLVAVLLPLVCKNRSTSNKSLISKIIAFIILSHVIISPYKDLYLLQNPYNWKEILPIHMCDLSEIFLAAFLLGGPKILYKCAFFWGLAGASMAIITPDIPVIDLDYAFFMIGHGMIVIGIMYATISLGNRPYAKDILTVSAITAFVLLPIVYLINLILGEPANYWYLIAKPAGASLMDAFPEPPLHLLITTPLAIAMFYLIYIPYAIKDKLVK